MLKEVIVVEGKMDVVAIKKALDAHCICTHGFNLKKETLKDIEYAYKKRGIIILTDPDFAGERIRKYLADRFPLAKHAFISRSDATANNDIGVEQASKDAILKALNKLHISSIKDSKIFSMEDLFLNDLCGSENSTENRAKLGAILGIGFCNGKTFLKRLNHYGITKEEFNRGIKEMQKAKEIV